MPRLSNRLRALIKFLLSIALLCVLAAAGFAAWLYFYTSDLPATSAMAVYMADGGGVVLVPTKFCAESVMVVAIPGVNVPNFRLALLAAEGDFDPRSFLRRLYDATDHTTRYGHYSDQLARQMVCGSSGGNLKRSILEIRIAIQLERHFTPDQLLDIYLNRAYFGPGIYGAQEAARRYFGKRADDLSTAETALLAGLVKSPARFSPLQHPDRALARRNEVIDAMLQRGSISPEEAQTAKHTSLVLTSN